MDLSRSGIHVSVLALFLTTVPGTTLMADSRSGDQDMERYLLKAEVTRIHMVMSATTYPMSVDLERKKDVRRAAFKYGHSDGPPIDDFRHEIAAYRLDRALDMHMVPVAVRRHIKTDGALIEWISPAFTEPELREQGKLPMDTRRLDEQRAVMHVFDALIMNQERKADEQLITPDDWNLHLIDHSRAFQTSTDLPESFVSHPCHLPPSLERKLEKLEAKPLKILFQDLLSDAQIAALLERRDKILLKIATDREEMGDEEPAGG
jgi:hypothetical protein